MCYRIICMLSFLFIAESENLSSPEIVSFPVENIGEVTVYGEDITIQLLGNTGLEFVLHHTNDVYKVNTIDRNCSGINIDLTNIYEILRNKKCQTNFHILKLFYDVNTTHNITFVDSDIIPFFEDIDITFINKQCVEDFRQFVSIHGNIRITNEDIHYFLKNVTDCMGWIALNNQTIFQVDLYQDKSLSKTGVASRKEAKIMFSFEDEKCLDSFIDFVGLYGFFDVEYGTFLVSPSNINEFYRKHQCLDFRIGCFGEQYEIGYILIPPKAVTCAASVLTAVIVVVNTFVLKIFLQKKNRSPMKIMLSAIALTDMLTAVFSSTPRTIAHLFYGRQISFFPYYNSWQWDSYEYLTHMLSKGSLDFGHILHMTSIYNTAALCIQKVLSLMFPIWSKIYIKNKTSWCIAITMFVFALVLKLPLIIADVPMSLNMDGILCLDESRDDLLAIINYTYLIMFASYIFAFIVMTVCSFYIACKLTLLRKNLKWVESQEIQKRNRRSALIIVLICAICILSEVITILTFSFGFDYEYFEKIDTIFTAFKLLFPYEMLSVLIGFSCNFIAYLFMGQQLRKTMLDNLKSIKNCLKCKCKYKHNK